MPESNPSATNNIAATPEYMRTAPVNQWSLSEITLAAETARSEFGVLAESAQLRKGPADPAITERMQQLRDWDLRLTDAYDQKRAEVVLSAVTKHHSPEMETTDQRLKM